MEILSHTNSRQRFDCVTQDFFRKHAFIYWINAQYTATTSQMTEERPKKREERKKYKMATNSSSMGKCNGVGWWTRVTQLTIRHIAKQWALNVFDRIDSTDGRYGGFADVLPSVPFVATLTYASKCLCAYLHEIVQPNHQTITFIIYERGTMLCIAWNLRGSSASVVKSKRANKMRDEIREDASTSPHLSQCSLPHNRAVSCRLLNSKRSWELVCMRSESVRVSVCCATHYHPSHSAYFVSSMFRVSPSLFSHLSTHLVFITSFAFSHPIQTSFSRCICWKRIVMWQRKLFESLEYQYLHSVLFICEIGYVSDLVLTTMIYHQRFYCTNSIDHVQQIE